jgi:hypothetical protein
MVTQAAGVCHLTDVQHPVVRLHRTAPHNRGYGCAAPHPPAHEGASQVQRSASSALPPQTCRQQQQQQQVGVPLPRVPLQWLPPASPAHEVDGLWAWRAVGPRPPTPQAQAAGCCMQHSARSGRLGLA